ncbi:acid cluster protein 33 homologue, putative [Plasmodium vivax]|nr:acid cluster protein 33 homologue, putative [Plasmodium vivax]
MESPKASMHEAYKSFCSQHPLKKLSMPKSDLVWSYYDINSRNENIVIFLHGICGTAGCYFYQLDALANLGFRVISFQYPCYNYLKDWIKNMCNILEYLNIKKAHFFASDLGGYLMQLYAKLYPSKVESLILCNSYRRTDDFAAVAAFRNVYGKLYSFLPHVLLKKIILENYIYVNYVNIDLKEKNSLEFMSNEVDLISSADLGGRISLQLSSENVDSICVNDRSITILQTLNNTYADSLNEDMKNAYPYAKHAILKSGGSFPYLSRHEEVNMYILVHLRNNCNAVFVKEQISSMSYMHQLKSEEVDIEQFASGRKFGKRVDGNVRKMTSEGGKCKISTINRCGTSPSSGDMHKGTTYHTEGGDPNGATFSYKERRKTEEGKIKQGVRSIRRDGHPEEQEDLFNLYKYGSYNSCENFSRKDTVTSEETVNSHEKVDAVVSSGQHSRYRGGAYGEVYPTKDDFHAGGISAKFCEERHESYAKQNPYEEQNEHCANLHNYTNEAFPDDPDADIVGINHNDGYYKNGYQHVSRNVTREDDVYGSPNGEYTYTSNEDIQTAGRSVRNSEERYNDESLNYADSCNENDPRYGRANVNKNDIFCHF